MTTFVTAFLDLQEDRSKDKSVDTCFTHFSKLCSSGIPLVVFLSRRYADRIVEAPHIHYIFTELNELVTWQETLAEPRQLPSRRTDHHDTQNFMILMNAKAEFVKKAMDINPFKSSQFAWIDFSICHVFRNTEASLLYLRMLAQSKLRTPCLLFPGCWSKGIGELTDAINWRFCGGFFIGDKNSLEAFYEAYRHHYPRYLAESKTLTWEVNVWHRLELEGVFCEWFKADHNDSIVRIPPSYMYTVASLTTIPSRAVSECRRAIDSLLPQVDHVYLNIAQFYKRFQKEGELPPYLLEEPYRQKVTVTFCEDKGPATKYLGALATIPSDSWIFFCDDDQEYAPTLLDRMRSQIDQLCIYQNRYAIITDTTSGGLIHGFVGNLGHASLYKQLPSFPLPDCAFHIDDQWLSVYAFLQNIPIRPSGVEAYSDIFKRLENGHECIGADALFSLGTRDICIQQLAKEFNVRFIGKGVLVSAEPD